MKQGVLIFVLALIAVVVGTTMKQCGAEKPAEAPAQKGAPK